MKHNKRCTFFAYWVLIGTLGLTGQVQGALFDNGLINDFSGTDVGVSEVRDGAGGSTTRLSK